MKQRSQSCPADRLVEWLFAGMMLTWGVWLLLPWWDTFSNPQYAVLASLAGEATWGAFSCFVALTRLAALLVNGRHRFTPIVRIVCSGFGLTWWMVLIYLFLITPIANPPAGFSWYPLFALFEAISVYRSAADALHQRSFTLPPRSAVAR